MSFLDPSNPLWMPKGSVRAVIAIMLIAGYFYGVVDESIVMGVIGFYFGSRVTETK